MRAGDYVDMAYRNFPLRNLFVEVERQSLREATVVQANFKSESLGLMMKLFVSEMEGEGGIYIAPLGTELGYREEGGWLSPWAFSKTIAHLDNINNTPLYRLRGIDPLAASCDIQLQFELEWVALNLPLISSHFHSPT